MHKSTTSKRKLPDTWLVVFFILVVIAILTWVVPSGSFDYETIDIDGTARKVAIAGSYSGIGYRAVCFVVLMGAAVAYLMLYARKVRRKPELSVVYGDSCTHSFERSQLDSYTFTWRHTLILLDVLATLVILMMGMIRWK